jgi:hypothetical protein
MSGQSGTTHIDVTKDTATNQPDRHLWVTLHPSACTLLVRRGEAGEAARAHQTGATAA